MGQLGTLCLQEELRKRGPTCFSFLFSPAPYGMCLWHSWWVFPPQFSLPRNTLRCTQRYVHRWFTILSSCQSRSPITSPKHYFSWMNWFEHKSVLRKRRGTTDTLDGIGFAVVCFVLIFLPSWEPFFIFFQDSFSSKPWSQTPRIVLTTSCLAERLT